DNGFEIGNHTKSHPDVTSVGPEELRSELRHIQSQCAEHGIPAPITFGYPGSRHNLASVHVLAGEGFVVARRGPSPEASSSLTATRGPAYAPHNDHPLLIPMTFRGVPGGPIEDLVWAVNQARDGKIASLTFHGVPCPQFPWCSVELDIFAAYMRYLRDA